MKLFQRIFGKRVPVQAAELITEKPKQIQRLAVEEVVSHRSKITQDVGLLKSASLRDLYTWLYRTHPWLLSAIDKIADRSASSWLWLDANEEVSAGRMQENPAHREVMRRLIEYPNPNDCKYEFAILILSTLKLTGEIFLEVVSVDGVPSSLYLIEGSVKIYYNDKGKIEKYVQTINGAEGGTWKPNDVIHIRRPDIAGGLYGMSGMDALLDTLTSDFKIITRNNNLTGSSSQGRDFILPSGIAESEVKRNKAEIAEKEKRAESLILEGAIEIRERNQPARDGQFLEQRKLNRAEIASVLGIPLTLISGIDPVTNNQEDTDVQLYYGTVFPLLSLIASKLNHYFAQLGYEDFVYVPGQYKPKALKDAARLIDVGAKNGLLTINEARNLLGYDDVEGGEEMLTPVKEQAGFGQFGMQAQPSRGTGVTELAEEKEPRNLKNDLYQFGVQFKMTGAIKTELDKIAAKLNEAIYEVLGDSGTGLSKKTLADSNAEKDALKIIQKAIKGDELEAPLEEYGTQGYKAGARSLGQYGPAFKFGGIDKTAVKAIKDRAIQVSDESTQNLVDQPGGIKDTLVAAIEAGKNSGEIAEELAEKFADISENKAAEIARSEPARAYNQGRFDVADGAGVTQARIELGPDPCQVCVEAAANFGEGAPIEDVQEFFDAHHPNVDCTFVPVVEV